MANIEEIKFLSFAHGAFVNEALVGTVQAEVGKRYIATSTSTLILPDVANTPNESVICVKQQSSGYTTVIDNTSVYPGEPVVQRTYTVNTDKLVCFTKKKFFGYPRWVVVANYKQLAGLPSDVVGIPGPAGDKGPLGPNLLNTQPFIWLPAGSLLPFDANGSSPNTLVSSVNGIVRSTQRFDAVVEQALGFQLVLPNIWTPSLGLSIQVLWTASGGTPGDTVRWELSSRSATVAAALDGVYNNPAIIEDVLQANDVLHISEFSQSIQLGNLLDGSTLLQFKLARKVLIDTLPVYVDVLGIRLKHDTFNSSSSSSSSSSSTSSSSSSSSSTSSSSSSTSSSSSSSSSTSSSSSSSSSI